jgi:membrane protein insertase Oxa1/YidC/SpoIIIJ
VQLQVFVCQYHVRIAINENRHSFGQFDNSSPRQNGWLNLPIILIATKKLLGKATPTMKPALALITCAICIGE